MTILACSRHSSSQVEDAVAANGRLAVAFRSIGFWLREALPGIAIFACIVLVYLPSLSAEFIWDDNDYVTENSALRRLDGLWRIWSDPRATPQYYPLVFTTFWIEHHLWGLDPRGYHLVNVLLHAANAVLIARVLQQLRVPGAWLAAILFGLHPVHVESVAWVTERKNVLSAFFYLLALRQLLSWQGFSRVPLAANAAPPGESRSATHHYVLGAALFVAALLSKSVTCSLPAVVLLILWQRGGRLPRRDALLLFLLFVIGLAFALHTAWLERAHVGASGTGFEWTLAQRVLIAGRALWFYAGKLVWPVDLAFMYPRWPIDTTSPLAWCIAISVALVPLLLAMRGRGLRAPLIAVLYFGGTLVPALGFFSIYPMRYYYVADHYQYLASLGLISIGAVALTGAKTRRRLATARVAVLVVVLGGLAYLTWQRQSVFQNSKALWTDTLAKNPTSMAAHIHLGRLASSAGDLIRAEQYFRDGLRLRTDDFETHVFETNLGVSLSAQRRYPEAIEMFEAALRRVPNYFEALNGLGVVAGRQGHVETAISLLRRALAEQPHSVAVRLNLATALAQSGQREQAERELRQALQEDPTAVLTYCMLAQVLAQSGRLAEAEQAARTAVRLDPKFATAGKLLEQIERDLGRRANVAPER